MKTVHLNALDIDAPVPDNFFLHYECEVDDIYSRLCELFLKYGKEADKLSTINQRVGGIYFITGIFDPYSGSGKPLAEAHSHILISRDQSPEDKMFSMGHEETHCLVDIEGIELLQKALMGLKVGGDSLEGLTLETICDIGGFYALVTNIPLTSYKLVERVDDSGLSDWLKKHTSWHLSG